MIALVVADMSNKFFMEAAKGLEEEVASKGYNLVIASSDADQAKERALITALVERRVDGICIAPTDTKGDTINSAIAGGTPVVLIDRCLKDVNSSQVLWNDRETAKELTNRILAAGHQRIGVINVTLRHSTGQERLEGVREAMKEVGLTLDKEYISGSNFSTEEAYVSTMRMLNKSTRPTALICANNIVADGALMAIREKHLKVGEDISVVSFGKLAYNRYVEHKIVTAHLDSYLMGKKAGLILTELIDGNDIGMTKVVLNATVQDGDSIGGPR